LEISLPGLLIDENLILVDFSPRDLWDFLSDDDTDELEIWIDENCDANSDDSTLEKNHDKLYTLGGQPAHSNQTSIPLKIQLSLCHFPPH
jgi:hypothetical protein